MDKESTPVYWRDQVRMNKEGRVLIPSIIRHALGLYPGDLFLEVKDGAVIIKPIQPIQKNASALQEVSQQII